MRRGKTRTLDRKMAAAPKLILRAVASIGAAWLLWGAVLNGSAQIASVVGRDSTIGALFAGITFWLGHFGMGIVFFIALAVALFYFTGVVLRRREQRAQQ